MSDFARLMETAKAAGVPVAPPANVDVPVVTGTGLVGEVLNCTTGNWSGEPTGYAYQWMSDAATPLGTQADYGVVADDVGHSLTCVVTASNAAGSAAAPPSNAVLITAASREAPTAQQGERSRSKTS